MKTLPTHEGFVGTFTLHLQACSTCTSYSLDFSDCSIPPIYDPEEMFLLDFASQTLKCKFYNSRENLLEETKTC